MKNVNDVVYKDYYRYSLCGLNKGLGLSMGYFYYTLRNKVLM